MDYMGGEGYTYKEIKDKEKTRITTNMKSYTDITIFVG